MATLHLTIKKKWFDMILSGEKKEEYREVKPYWEKRFCEELEGDFYSGVYVLTMKWKHYDNIVFTNGYSSNSPKMKVEFKGFRTSYINKLHWGATPDKLLFVLDLGEVLEVQNVEGY